MNTTLTSATEAGDRIRWLTVIAGFLAVVIDGFDAASLAVSVPTLSNEWGLPASSFTVPLVLTNMGVVVGYISAGTLCVRFPQHKVLVSSLAMTSTCSLLSAAALFTHSIPILGAARLATGVALGIVLPVAVSLTTSLNPERFRQRVSVIVTLGMSSGLFLGGILGRYIIQGLGASAMFWAGGIAAAPVVILVVCAMKGRAAHAGADAATSAKVARLFDGGLRVSTLLLWCFSFLIFIAGYTLNSWTPTLVVQFGFNASEAPIGLAFVSFGGILGGLLLLPLIARVKIASALVIMAIIGTICTIAIGIFNPGQVLVLLLLMGAGIGIASGQQGQSVMAVSIYPVGTRTTGVGWSAAIGRIGSIVGPSIAGVLISLSVSAQNIVLFLAAIPVLTAMLCAAAIGRSKSTPTVTAANPRPSENAQLDEKPV